MLPTPRYVVFYNGTVHKPDKMTFRLSDAFEVPGGCLECEVTMVLSMILTTFNQELYENGLKKDAYMDGVEAGISEGKAIGMAEGLNQQLLNLIQKKLAKGKSIEAIADELEESVDTIQDLISQLSDRQKA